MKLAATSFVGLGLVASSTAQQIVHLTFHGGPASYNMAFPADGTVYPTNNGISVDSIDDNDYDAIPGCTFHTDGPVTLAQHIDTTNGNQSILVGPPQPITGVSCSGMCVGIYGECYNTNGQFVGPCCNGFCAADRCRPWIIPSQ